MINWQTAQQELGVTADGVPGTNTYMALIRKVAGNPVPLAAELAMGMSRHIPRYGVDDNTRRLCAFLAQTCHETMHFRRMEEMGGPSYFAKYDGRKDLGNTQPGDGARYHGRGAIQLTGRANYAEYGKALGLDLVGQPSLAAQPSTSVLIALEFWKRKGLNALADAGDMTGITRRINGGLNGLPDRLALYAKAMEIFA